MKTILRACGLWLVAALTSVAQAATITYYHNDFAGSPVVATNQSGQVIWRESYRPYGERLTNSAASSGNDIWFASRRQDVDTGLVYMGARYYDPVVGRFMSKDPVGFVDTNVHSFSRYAYANNNPFRYIDPTGRAGESFVGRAMLGLLGLAGFEAMRQTREEKARNVEAAQKAWRGLFSGNTFNESENPTAETGNSKGEAKAEKPADVPDSWVQEPGRKEGHTKWVNPDNEHDYVRARPDGTLTQVRNGKALDASGKAVDLNSPDAHGITPDNFVFRP